MGIFIGGFLGFKFGALPGLFFGAWLGYWIETQITGRSKVSNNKATQECFFNALFLSMGRLAKIDGQVSPLEIERTEGIIRHMNLNQDMRQRAINLFNQGKNNDHDIDAALRQFGQFARRSLSLKQIFLEMLIDVAEADGLISREEQVLIEQTCELIGYPVQLLYAMLKMRGFASTGGGFNQKSNGSRSKKGHYGGQQSRQRSVNRQAPFNPYQVLGVEQSDNKAKIRKAYKRLISQHHPDKLVSKGLPPEMMKVAEEKAKQVQLAWERVKELKGW